MRPQSAGLRAELASIAAPFLHTLRRSPPHRRQRRPRSRYRGGANRGGEPMKRRAVLGRAARPRLPACSECRQSSGPRQPITLNGASQFGDDHPYTKAMVRFEELVKQYWGKPMEFCAAEEQQPRAREAVFRDTATGPRGRISPRLARAHVDIRQGRAPRRRALPFRDLGTSNKVLDSGRLQAGGGRRGAPRADVM